MKWSAPLVLAAAVLVAVASIGAVTYWQGREVAGTLEARTVEQVHGRIADRLRSLLDGPVRWNRQVVDLIERDRLSTTNVRRWRSVLFEQAPSFNKTISGVCWGGAERGRTAWVFRYEGQDHFEWGVRDEMTDWLLHEQRLDAAGLVLAEDEPKVSEYDPRARPWYTMAAEAGHALWGEPYVWISNGESTGSLGLPYMTPVYERDGSLLGVVDVELGLRDLSDFLSRIKVGDTGLAYVMDREGRLIATSVDTALSRPGQGGVPERLPAAQSEDRRIASVSRWLTRDARRVIERRTSTDRAEASDSSGMSASDSEPIRSNPLESEASSNDNSSKSHQTIDESVGMKAWPQSFDGRLDLNGEAGIVRMTRFTHQQGLEWLIVTVVPEVDITEGVEAIRRRGMALAAAAVLAALLFGIFVAAWLIRPLIRVSEHVHRIGKGDLETDLQITHSPEVNKLSDELNEMTAGLRDRLALRKSLAMAMEVQQNLLPDTEPSVSGLDLAGHSIYCDETGGDYYDFIEIAPGDEGHGVSIVVGDVMGHGIAAAMLMATARGVLRSRARQPGTLADLLDHLNELLVDVTAGKRFMTMVMLNIEPKSRTVRWASAGHDAPFVYDPEQDRFLDLGEDDGGLPLGVAEFAEYEEYTLDDLPVGSILVGSTDGMWESRNPAGDMHGKEALMQVIRDHRDCSARDIAAAMHDALAAFRGEAPQEDDETYVVVKLTEPNPNTLDERMQNG
ncbi:MAG: SpoIIE family protein phosphatase [Planctomycetota bacterium]